MIDSFTFERTPRNRLCRAAGVPCRPRLARVPSPSPGTTGPLDLSCPGSAPRGERRSRFGVVLFLELHESVENLVQTPEDGDLVDALGHALQRLELIHAQGDGVALHHLGGVEQRASRHRRLRCDPSTAGLRRCASRLNSEMKDARILSESGPLRTELGRMPELGVFSASFSRMHLTLRPIEPAVASQDERALGTDVHAVARRGEPQGGAHERTQTVLGSVCPDDVARFHGRCLG
jgi:hypothetical protein